MPQENEITFETIKKDELDALLSLASSVKTLYEIPGLVKETMGDMSIDQIVKQIGFRNANLVAVRLDREQSTEESYRLHVVNLAVMCIALAGAMNMDLIAGIVHQVRTQQAIMAQMKDVPKQQEIETAAQDDPRQE